MKDKIEGLRPFFQRVVLAHKGLCNKEFRKEGMSVFYYCGYRSPSEQNLLYAVGRTDANDKRKPVTWAKGGESIHQYGWAVDFVPMLGGKPMWDDLTSYERAGLLAESLGLEWAGRWRVEKRESPHIQLAGGLNGRDMARLSVADLDAHIEARYRANGFLKGLIYAEKELEGNHEV